MNILVLGAGRMAYGFVFDMLKNKNIKAIAIIDRKPEELKEMFFLLSAEELIEYLKGSPNDEYTIKT